MESFVFELLITGMLIVSGLSQNPDGDMLMLYGESSSTPVCLAAALADKTMDSRGRYYQTNDIYPGSCKKSKEEMWQLRKESDGSLRLRLKADPARCLALDTNYPQARLTTCGDPKFVAKQRLELFDFGYPYEENFQIYGPSTGLYFKFDWNRHTFDMRQATGDSSTLLRYWAWVSVYEQWAAPVRGQSLVYPIVAGRNDTNLLENRHRAAQIDQLINNTRYQPITFTPAACAECDPQPCNCFPIDYTLSRLDTKSVKLNLAMNPGGHLYEWYLGRNLVATGMYAKPNVPITINLDRYNQSKITIKVSFFLQHVPSDYQNWQRPGHVTFEEVLQPGYNQIRSPYGGPIMLDVVGTDASVGVITAQIQNAAPMANFVLGQTTKENWPQEMLKEPNWFVFQGKYAAGLDLKKPYVGAKFDDVLKMVQRYDLLVSNNYLLNGYDFDAKPGSIHSVPQGWYWWMRDSSRGLYGGNPAGFAWYGHDKDISLKWENMNTWGFFHEFGHAFEPCFGSVFKHDVICNIYTSFSFAYFCGDGKQTVDCPGQPSAGENFTQLLPQNLELLAHGQTYFDLDYYQELLFWVQIFSFYGFEPYRYMNRRFRELSFNASTNVCNGNDQELIDAVYETLSEMCNGDLTSHFDTYRISLSDQVRKRVAARRYAKPSKNISMLGVPVGAPMNWNAKDPQPSFALPPYKF